MRHIPRSKLHFRCKTRHQSGYVHFLFQTAGPPALLLRGSLTDDKPPETRTGRILLQNSGISAITDFYCFFYCDAAFYVTYQSIYLIPIIITNSPPGAMEEYFHAPFTCGVTPHKANCK